MSAESDPFPKVLTLYLELSQYPILAPFIRELMRQEIFKRGVITPEDLEQEVLQKAVQSQIREGLNDPMSQETSDVWQQRLSIVRDNLTDFYFAYNLPHDLFEGLVKQTLAKQGPVEDVALTFHPELAPWDMLFSRGEYYETLAPDQRLRVKHHLLEIKVVLIKAMISDHLDYVGVAKEWLSIADLQHIHSRRIGRGKIGGKAAGIQLAHCILQAIADDDLLQVLHIPPSWFLGADVFYQFTQHNQLVDYANQKYLTEIAIRQDYPKIQEDFQLGSFPQAVLDGLRGILRESNGKPLIVRSSSLLEDSFGHSFAGKYESHFLPNQGPEEENLGQMLLAITSVYASVYSPDVLLYRQRMGLIDYDERMAILIQEVQGRELGDYFLPDAAGVAFSRNQFRWSPRIDRRSGFLRLVWGLGTRAVDQLGNEYPRLVALSHPELRPLTEPDEISRHSQRFVDLIDLKSNRFRTLTVKEALHKSHPALRYIGQRYSQNTFEDFLGIPVGFDPAQVVLTFDGLLRRTGFPSLMRRMLQILETNYQLPVDVEFLVLMGEESQEQLSLYLLQCRPQSRLRSAEVKFPQDIPDERRLFVSERMVPDGKVSSIRYVVYVTPNNYRELSSSTQQASLARVIGRINRLLDRENFILIGPGRWGSNNPALGIPVRYGDIYNAQALIELVDDETAPEPSYGTHFFQDLVEAHIYPLAVALKDPGAEFNRAFFEGSPNALEQVAPDESTWNGVVRILDIPALAGGSFLELVMDGELGRAIAYLHPDPHFQ